MVTQLPPQRDTARLSRLPNFRPISVVAQSTRHMVNSSHGHLVTRSTRHSPVNSSHNTDRICIPEKIVQVCQQACRCHHTALSNAAALDYQCPPTVAAVSKNSRAISRPPIRTYAAAPVTAREPKCTKKGEDLSG